MAEKALKKLSEQLQCAICLEIYTDPKQLHCNHVYCQNCLERLVVRDQQGQFILTCPNCRLITPISATGVAGLQSSFQVNNLLEIQDSLKQFPSMASLEAGYLCSVHPGEELKLYCQTCDELICLKCAIRNGRHHSHSYDELGEALEIYKGEIVSSLGPIENQLTTVSKALRHLDTRYEEIFKQHTSIEANIHDAIELFHDYINVRKTELVSQLHQIAQGKLQKLSIQREKLETTQAQLSSCLDYMRQNLSSDSREVLKTKSFLNKQVQQLVGAFQPATLMPSVEADMKFLASPDIKAVIEGYGSVAGMEEPSVSGQEDDQSAECGAVLEATVSVEKSSLPDPSKCFIVGEDLEISMVENTSVADLHVTDFNLQAFTGPVESIDCELISVIRGTTEHCTVQKKKVPGQYEISYQPTCKGRHQLHVKVNNQHILKSPLVLPVTSPVKTLGSLVHSICEIKRPWGVAINQSGEIVVTEHEGHSVLVFSPSGRKLWSFGSRGSGSGEFQNPRGVAIDKQGAIVVADYKNNRIQKFSADGKFIKSMGTKGSGTLQFRGPKGIAFNAFNNKLYIVDENHRVKIVNPDLTYYGSFGKIGWGKGQLNDPWSVSCDSTGRVYVADSTNNRIQVFAADGMYLGAIGKHGKGWGELIFPAGIAVDASDMLYVSERYNHRISIFSSEGEFVTSFGSFGVGEREFKYPRGVAVDSSGVVYVCDNNNNRISMF